MTKPADDNWRGAIRSALLEHSLLRTGSVLLLSLAVADLLVTHALLRRGPTFYESNPIADWIFRRWNVAGMAVFKFAAMGGVIAVAELVERRRPGRGRFVLLVGCLATAAVVTHGLRLLIAPVSEE